MDPLRPPEQCIRTTTASPLSTLHSCADEISLVDPTEPRAAKSWSDDLRSWRLFLAPSSSTAGELPAALPSKLQPDIVKCRWKKRNCQCHWNDTDRRSSCLRQQQVIAQSDLDREGIARRTGRGAFTEMPVEDVRENIRNRGPLDRREHTKEELPQRIEKNASAPSRVMRAICPERTGDRVT